MFNQKLRKIIFLSMGCAYALLSADTQQTSSSSLPAGNFSSVTVAKNETIEQNLTVVHDAQVTGDANANNLAVTTNAKIGGSLNVNGCGFISNNVQVTESVNTNGVNADVLNVCKETCQSLNTCSNKANDLTVVKDMRIGGKLLTDEIDPFAAKATCINGNMALATKKKLLVNEINPVSCKCDQECGNEKCMPDDNGITCFSGTVAVNPGFVDLSPNQTCPRNIGHSNNKILLTNHIDPVALDECGKCVHDDTGVTVFSGNVDIAKKLLVNEINPVSRDIDGKIIIDDSGMTCFSGNMLVVPDKTLYVNEIDPVIANNFGECIPDPSPCSATSIIGNMRIVNPNLVRNNGHYFGSISNMIRYEPESSNMFLANTIDLYPSVYPPISGAGYEYEPDYDYDDLEYRLRALYPITECEPVLRLTFAQTDKTKSPYPQGAWVKLNIFGTAMLNFILNDETHTDTPIPLPTDFCTELYFYVGPGNAAPCSAFVGTLNGLEYNNTLSSFFNMDNAIFRAPFFPPVGQMSQVPLFGMVPTAFNVLSGPSILGTTATSPNHPRSVDILLMGVLPPNKYLSFDYLSDHNYQFDNYGIYSSGPFGLFNLHISYEVISSNLDQKNPICLAGPLFSPDIYLDAAVDLIQTFSLYQNLPSDSLFLNNPGA